ncbi:MAG: LysM domain-containing protein [bacterium]
MRHRDLLRLPMLLALLSACSGDPELGGALQAAADRVMTEAIVVESLEPARLALEEVAATELRPRQAYAVEVRSGESLALYGRWLDLIPEAIAEQNGLDPYGRIDVGQRIKIDLDAQGQAKFEAARAAFSKARIDRFFKRRGGVHKVLEHKVERGETVLGIARRNGRLPLWVMRHYNPGRDLDTLSVGDTLKVPLMADRVVSQR